jgi:hypothetical protein
MENQSLCKKKPKERIESLLRFEVLSKKNSNLFELLQRYILEINPPIYGNQITEDFLKKIKEGKDRTCEFLVYRDVPVGVIIYKNKPNDEFADLGIKNGLELKTLLLLKKNFKTSGIFLRHLLSRAATKALELKASCVFGTVSSKKGEVLRIMLRLGFVIIKTFNSKYVKNINEHLICQRNPTELLIKK